MFQTLPAIPAFSDFPELPTFLHFLQKCAVSAMTLHILEKNQDKNQDGDSGCPV
jgi:hypothetical protein